MFTVGAIFNTHGLKGEVKVKLLGDFEERFYKGNTLYYKNEANEDIELLITGYRTQKEAYLLRFEGLDSIDDVLGLKGKTLYIKEQQLTELGEHEFYYHEIIGCTVYSTENEEIGIVDSILTPGANDVWVVKNKAQQEILIPYIEDVVKEVNVGDKQIIIEVMEGLLD